MHPSLYARCLRRLLPFLLLAGVAAAQTNPGDRVLLERGTTLDVALEHDVRMQAGVPVRARVVHPVYQGNELAIPAGAVALGHVNDVTAAPAGTYREGLWHGDFTPPRAAELHFDHVLLPGGEQVDLVTAPTTDGMQVMHFSAGKKRSFFRRLWTRLRARGQSAVTQVTAPGKFDRLKHRAYAKLPLHPRLLDSGLQYTVELTDAAEVPLPAHAAIERPNAPTSLTHAVVLAARLTREVSSATAEAGDPVNAVVSEPVLDAAGQVEVPPGARLVGEVLRVKHAGSHGHNGELRFFFRELQLPAGFRQSVHGTAGAVDADAAEPIELDAEGGAKPARPDIRLPFTYGLLSAASLRDDESTLVNTAASSNGFSIIGRVIALASGSHYVGAAIGLVSASHLFYERFLRHGRDVTFRRNTRVEIEISPERGPSLRPGPR